MLDYDGNAHEMGKNLGDDLREGKVTLPLIIAMQRGNTQEQAFAAQHHRDRKHRRTIFRHFHYQKTGALDATRQAAATQAQLAMDAAAQLPINPHSKGLLQLAAQLLKRRT